MKEKYLCNDKIYRKAFRIKGEGNILFVMYRRKITRASTIVIKKQILKKKNKKGGVLDNDIDNDIDNFDKIYEQTIESIMGTSEKEIIEVEELVNVEIDAIFKDVEIDQEIDELKSLTRKLLTLQPLLLEKGFIDDFIDDTIDYLYKSDCKNKIEKQENIIINRKQELIVNKCSHPTTYRGCCSRRWDWRRYPTL